MKSLIVIPARYASSRFPGKPLADIAGMSMIERVYRQGAQVALATDVIVATDDDRIKDHVTAFGGKVMMTNTDHTSGTDRCREVIDKLDTPFDYVVNLQGDEPFIDPKQIDALMHILDGSVRIATLAKRISDVEQYASPHVVKVTRNVNGRALYFSRSPIPYSPSGDNIPIDRCFKHIGIYAYRTDVLKEITQLPVSTLETTEKLEQLRWLENGYDIQVLETDMDTFGIDTEEDIQKALLQMGIA